MPMTEIEYAPIPEIPLVLLHREKQSFTVEEVLRAGLQVTLKVRSPQGPFDLVCLRLRSYMLQTDPIFQDQEVKRRLEALRAGVTTAQAARDSSKLQVLVESANDAVHGDSTDRSHLAVYLPATGALATQSDVWWVNYEG